jgi:DNA-binding transcriptional regulator YiaG
MKYKSDILEVIHQSAVDKFEIGAISKARMREYDEMCLAEESNTKQKIAVPLKFNALYHDKNSHVDQAL